MIPEKTARLPRRELAAALDLCRRSFPDSGAADGPEGEAAFRAFLDFEQMDRAVRSGLLEFYGHWTRGVMDGVAALREGSHIALLFVDRDCRGRGIGSGLLRAMARPGLTVNASPAGAGFYEAQGFRRLSEERRADGLRSTPMILEGDAPHAGH